MTAQGVVDRLINGEAIVLIEYDSVKEEFILNADQFNLKEGDVVDITLENTIVVNVEVNLEETEKAKYIMKSKMDSLKRKGSKYKLK